MNKIYKLLLITFLSTFFNGLYAQVSVYDTTFGTGGKLLQIFTDADIVPNAIVLQTDGKLVVGGSGGDFTGGVFKIVRYQSNGSIDFGFGDSGIVSFEVPSQENLLQSLVIQPDQKIIGAGFIDVYDSVIQQTNQDFFLFRLKTDGSFDSTFGINGRVVTNLATRSNEVLHKIILKPDGKIIAGGFYMDMNNGDNYYGIVQYNNDGSRDSTFGTNGINTVRVDQQENDKGSMALLPGGKIMVGATLVNDTSGFYEFGLLRFLSNGALDTTFAIRGIKHLGINYFHSQLHDMAIQSDGKMVLAGQTQGTGTSIAVLRINADGNFDSTFGMNGVVRTHLSTGPYTPDAGMTVSIQTDNKILVGATLDDAINSMDADFALIRYLTNGQIDSTFGRQGSVITDIDGNGDFARTGILQPDGKYILVGSAESQNYQTGIGIVRYVSDARYYYNNFKGSVYYDNNANGIKDSSETYFGNTIIALEKPGVDTLFVTASAGQFNVEIDTGTYIIRIVQQGTQNYYNSVPAFQTITHSNYYNTDSVSFAMQPIPGRRDIFIKLIPLNTPRPGFTTNYKIMYGNKGTDTIAAGTVRFLPPARVNIASTTPAISSMAGDTLIWNFTNLFPGDTSYIIIRDTIQAPPLVNNGDTLISFAEILPSDADLYVTDNFFNLREIVVGSFDPNDKTESHAGQITPAQVASGEFLQYMIRFQNTGTDTAFTIRVRDTLSVNLDWNSAKMVASSHAYSLSLQNGIAVWTFNNILLPATSQNEPASHGYIVFEVKPKSNLVLGNSINNTASIYFDFNLPIITNTETTTVLNAPVPTPDMFTLINFTATKSGPRNLLSWVASNVSNINRFEIERSAFTVNFERTGTIINSGNVLGNVVYEYVDAAPLQGMNYYRLAIIKNDGSITYSPVRLVNNSKIDFALQANPVTDMLQLNITREQRGMLRADVISSDGRTVLSPVWSADAGNTIKTINTAGLSAGIYFVKIVSLSARNVTPIILRFEKL